jgi:hypothetical protein
VRGEDVTCLVLEQIHEGARYLPRNLAVPSGVEQTSMTCGSSQDPVPRRPF